MLQNQSRFSGEKILITDDEQVIVELTSLLLKKRGFEVLTAQNGLECLEVVSQHQPAVVLLDYMMPVMNGLDALKKIHADYPDCYVVMFTGKGSEEVAVQLMKAGAADYLQKPFSNQNLIERIDSVLSVRQVEIENRQLLKEREFLQQEIKEWNHELEQRVLQKSRELELAHKEIILAEKLAALGHISAGMAHEIRNPLNSINLFAQILLSVPELDEENCGYALKIIQEVERIDNILVQMLAASKGDQQQENRVDLTRTIEKVLSNYRVQIESQQVEVATSFDRDPPTIQADSLEIEQIFTNLVGNALYEMPTGGRLTITLRSDAEKILIKVSDTGKGIPSKNLSRVFDPFFTTKEKGTGFGLSVVLRIVNSCGGKITADSVAGDGASFMIELPLLPASVH